MLRTLGIVEACFTTPEARAKAARRLRGKTILEWVVRRATDCQRLDGVMVVTSQSPENASVIDLVPTDVPVFVAAAPDALGQLAAALEEYPAEGAVRLSPDAPFVDPALIDRLVITAEEHPQCDYVSYCSRDGRPAILSPVGVFAEWFRAAALLKIAKRATCSSDRCHATRYIYSHPEKFNIRLIPAPEKIDREDVRLTVDIEEDWDHVLAIVDALGPEVDVDWQRIADLLDHQPALRERMAALNRVYAKG
jgi:spore coat polysaccharide biosynthesis protein SpsF